VQASVVEWGTEVGRVEAEFAIELVVDGFQGVVYFLLFPRPLLPFCRFLLLLLDASRALRKAFALCPSEASVSFWFWHPRFCVHREGDWFQLLLDPHFFFGDGARCCVLVAPRLVFFCWAAFGFCLGWFFGSLLGVAGWRASFWFSLASSA